MKRVPSRAQDVRETIAKVIDDLDSGRSPDRGRSPWWVRSLASPVALGLALGLGGCLEPEDPEPEECWSDHECDEGYYCAGVSNCPDGAYCILPAQAGTCEPEPASDECWDDDDCPDGMTCEGASPCPEGALCILPATPGTCEDSPALSVGECWSDDDCDAGTHCEGASTCPSDAYCILPSSPGECVDDDVVPTIDDPPVDA